MSLLVPWALVAVSLAVPFTGTVEDPAGRPVEGATVWLADSFRREPGTEILIEAKTDATGRFQLDRPDTLAGRGVYWSPTVWAYKPGHRVVYREFKKALPRADEPVRLALGPPARTGIRVLMPDGKPAQNARVRPTQLHIPGPWAPDPMFAQIERTTDAEGRVVLDGLNPEDIRRVDVAIEGYVTQGHSITTPATEEQTILFRRVGELSARFVADDPAAVRGWTLTAWTTPRDPAGAGLSTSWNRVVSDEAGLVKFRPLAEGSVSWRAVPPAGSAYLAVDPPPLSIRAGEKAEAVFKLRKAITIEGTVVEEPGGAPVPGAEVNVTPLRYNGSINTPVTDAAAGRFSFRFLPGEFRFSLHEVPKTHYLPPERVHWLDFKVEEGEERHVLAPFPLRRATQIRGRVLNEAGQPEPNANVSGEWSVTYGRDGSQVSARPTARATTDENGDFVLGSALPGASVQVWAQVGSVAESPRETVVAADGATVTLRVKKNPTQAISGRVVGPDGRPMAGATVQILTRPRQQRFGRNGIFVFPGGTEFTTDRDGIYRTPAELPLSDSYSVEVRAPGMQTAESPWIDPPVVEIPTLTLRRAPLPPRTVTGRVIDTAGKPVEGAEVVQSGDGPERIRTMTDADGRFSVPNYPSSPALLFAHKSGYQWTGRRVEPADRAADLTLTRDDEPTAARLAPVPTPVPRDEERAIARDLLDPAWKDRRSNPEDHQNQSRAEQAMALLDPDRITTMIENQVLKPDLPILTNLSLGRFDVDPRAAMEDLATLANPVLAAESLLALADRVAGVAGRDLRREMLDRALKRAREDVPVDRKVVLLARVADRLFDLGESAKATTIVREAEAALKAPNRPRTLEDEAREVVIDFPISAGSGNEDLAVTLAWIDPAAALKALEGIEQGYALDRLRGRVAERIAGADPDAADRLIGLIKYDQDRISARQRACVRLATRDLAAARKFAEKMRAPVVTAALPAIAARELAGTDPARARALLRESFEQLGKLSESGLYYNNPPLIAMAQLLPLAARIDPDHAVGDFWFTLACRPPLPATPVSSYVYQQSRELFTQRAELAWLIARFDRSTAEIVMRPVVDHIATLSDDLSGLQQEREPIFKAAAAYDARVARAMWQSLREDPAPAPRDSNGNPSGPRFAHKTKATARLDIVEMLGLPPELRRTEPLQKFGGHDWLQSLSDGPTVGEQP